MCPQQSNNDTGGSIWTIQTNSTDHSIYTANRNSLNFDSLSLQNSSASSLKGNMLNAVQLHWDSACLQATGQVETNNRNLKLLRNTVQEPYKVSKKVNFLFVNGKRANSTNANSNNIKQVTIY